MEINCIKCGAVIPPQRLKALPNTKVCINCSNVSQYRGVTVTLGERQDTWNELVPLNGEQQKQYEDWNKISKKHIKDGE